MSRRVYRSPGGRADGTFVVLDKSVLHDGSLSFRARGLHAWMLDHPADWEFSADRIAQDTTEGRDAIRTAMNELEAVGLLRRVTTSRGDKGMTTIVQVRECTGIEWASPQVNTTTDSQASGSQASGNQASKRGTSQSNITEHRPFRAHPAGERLGPTTSDLIREHCPDMARKQLIGLARNVEHECGHDERQVREMVAALADEFHHGGDPMTLFTSPLTAWDDAGQWSEPMRWSRAVQS